MKQIFRKDSIIIQVAIFFLIGIITTGILTYFSEIRLYENSVKSQTERHAAETAEETRLAVTEFPAYQWLIRYWYAHPDTLDIEYDADLSRQTQTARKCRIFSERHPDMQIRYMDLAQCATLPEEDQKLYAEIAYSWLISRIDQIKRSYHVSFLFCVISEEPFDRQFFLFSGADQGAVRGTNYEEVYPLGHVVSVSKSQTEAMRKATKTTNHLADAGIYLDYYTLLFSFDGHSALIGLTYDLSALQEDITTQTRTGAQLAILNQLVLSAICLVLIFFFLLRPLKKVQKQVRAYKETKDGKAVIEELESVRSRNEIGRLSVGVSEMVREIEAHIEEIRSISAEKERIHTELELATRIQAAMLPNTFPAFPNLTEFDVYASMEPAREVGGDFYDFFLIDEDRLGLVIADVSGKGIPAALFMMISKILVKNHAMNGLSPAAVLEAVNRQICANNREEMFVTVWLGILELSTGKLTAANAGHEYPTLKQGERFDLLKDRHGFVIGGMESAKYKDYELQLAPGDKVFVFTDGIAEATAADNGMFGTERMLAALNENPAASPEQILKNVQGAVSAFVQEAEQFDDMTMLCLEYKGPAGSPDTNP